MSQISLPARLSRRSDERTCCSSGGMRRMRACISVSSCSRSQQRSAGSGSSEVKSSSMARAERGCSPMLSSHSSSVRGTGSGTSAAAFFSQTASR